MRTLHCLATTQSAAVPPYFNRTKALRCQKRDPSGTKERGFIVLPPSSSPPRPHLPVVLAWQRGGDFLFWFLCWRSEFPGMWNQRRRCHVSPRFFSNPSQQSLWDGEQRISSSMRNCTQRRVIARRAEVRAGRQFHV